MIKMKRKITKIIFSAILTITMLICSFGIVSNLDNFITFADMVDDVEYSITQIIDGQTPNGNYITINNAEELIAFSSVINQGLYNDGSYKYKLTSNIELNENSENYAEWEYDPPANAWIPIGLDYDYPFAGVFDGQGFTISGLYINNTEDYQGLFGCVSSVIIKNLNLKNIYVKGGHDTGGLVGVSNGLIANCAVFDGLVCSDFYENWTTLGGIVGCNDGDGEIVNCYNLSVVRGSGQDGEYYIGGIAGISWGIVRNCYNAGGIVGGADYKGSIGHNDHVEGRYSRTNYWLEGTCGIYGKTADCNQGIDDSFDENGLMLTQNNTYIEIDWYTESIPLSEENLYEMLNAFVSIHNDFYADDISAGSRAELKTWTPTALPTIAYNRSIVFDQNGGEFNSEYTVQTSYLEGTTLNLPTQEQISKMGCTFNGWTQLPTEWDETTNPYITSITILDLGNKTFYANWSINQYTVTFISEGGVVLGTSTVNYGTVATYPNATPTKSASAQYSYLFDNWYTAETDGTIDNLQNITANRNVYARFTSSINKYEYIFYDEDGSTVLKEETVDYGTQIIAPTNPERTSSEQFDYTFEGWYTAQTDGTKVETFGNINENGATYYARYSAVEIPKEHSLVWLWILLGCLGVGVIVLSILWIFLSKKEVKFILNDKQVEISKYKRGEDLNFPTHLANFKWFYDKKETKLFTQKKMGWFGFSIYRNSKSDPNVKQVEKRIKKQNKTK